MYIDYLLYEYSRAEQNPYGFIILDKLEGLPQKNQIFRFLGINFRLRAGRCSFGKWGEGRREGSRSAQAVFPPGVSTLFPAGCISSIRYSVLNLVQ